METSTTDVGQRRLEQPPHDAAQPNDGGDVEAYRGQLYGGEVVASPGEADAEGQRTWTVRVTTGDGRTAQVDAKLTGQFGPEHLASDSYVKQRLNEQLQADAAAAAEPSPDQQLDAGAEKEKNSDSPDSLQGKLLGTVQPDFLVGSIDAGPSGNHQIMVDPWNPSSVLHYKTLPGESRHGASRTEVVNYDFTGGKADVVNREHGWQKTWKAGPEGDEAVFNVNIRGGDSTFNSPEHGATINFSITGAKFLSNAFSQSGKGKSQILEKGLGNVNQLLHKTGSDAAVAWKGKFVRDNETGEMFVDFGEFKVNWDEFQEMVSVTAEEFDPVNKGDREIARANNVEAYFDGANPFDRAVQTRDGDEFVNHGDPIADISARLIELGDMTDTYTGDADYVRSNSDARTALQRGVEMYNNTDTPVSREYIEMPPPDERPDTSGPSFTPEEKAHFETTMALLHEYGVAGLYDNPGETKVADLAEQIHSTVGDDLPPPQMNQDFVQSVFEGEFRNIPDYGNPVVNFALDALSLKFPAVGMALTVYEVGNLLHSAANWDPSEIDKPVREGVAQGMLTRLEENDGGVLQALGIEAPAGASEQERAELEGQALAALLYELQENHIDGRAVQAQTYYEAFQGMSEAERQAVGEAVESGDWETGQW